MRPTIRKPRRKPKKRNHKKLRTNEEANKPLAPDFEYHSNPSKQNNMETFNDVISDNKPVLVDFFATWCQPCKMMHPVLDEVKQAMGDRLRIIKIDIDKQNATATRYRIQSVPTLMLFRNGEQLWRGSGYLSRAELLSAIGPFLNV